MTFNSIIKKGKIPVLLAPMAGVTDLPFRNVVSKFGVDMVFSEMIADHSVLSRPLKNQKIENSVWGPKMDFLRSIPRPK